LLFLQIFSCKKSHSASSWVTLLLRVEYWIDMNIHDNTRLVAIEIRRGIEKRFAQNGIAIAFPQRDVNFSSRDPVRVEVVLPQ
jgi:small-conductance mechanosensitive channel